MRKTLQEKMFHEMEQKDIFRQAQDYAFDYADHVLERNVYPTPDAIADLDMFVEKLPKSTGNAAEILEQLNQYGAPASVAQTGGRYFGFVNGGVIPASLAVRWLSDFWDQNTALYVISPIASKLKEVSESWLRELLGLPEKVVAGFVSGSSLAIFCGLAAARYRIFRNNNWDINKKGFYGAPKVRVVAGRQAHGTVVKAIALLGFGIDNIEWVGTDTQGRIIPSEIPELDESTILILQAGNVSSGAFDSFDELCEKANKAHAWVHIDGAFGLWAALKYLGKEGVDELVSGLHQRAVQIGKELKAENFQILNDVVFNQVLVACDSEKITVQTMRHIQESGECWVGGASWDGKAVIRVSICSWATTEDDITRSVSAFVTARNKAVHELRNT